MCDEYRFKEFGQRLKMLRQHKGIRQSVLADTLGISRQSMSNYESGKHSPDIDVIMRMADYFGCSTDYLLGIGAASDGHIILRRDDMSSFEQVMMDAQKHLEADLKELRAIQGKTQNLQMMWNVLHQQSEFHEGEPTMTITIKDKCINDADGTPDTFKLRLDNPLNDPLDMGLLKELEDIINDRLKSLEQEARAIEQSWTKGG